MTMLLEPGYVLMLIFSIALFTFITVSIISVLIFNWYRQKVRYQFKIHNNCLLTNHSIVFISGKKSLFYFGRYWNCIPEWLRAHGYDVLEINYNEIAALLDISKGLHYHFAGDESVASELNELAKLKTPNIVSVSLFGSSQRRPLIEPNIRFHFIQPQKMEAASQKIWNLITSLHSLTKAPLKASTVCAPGFHGSNNIIRQYLNWAISLAETDMS